MIVDPRYDPEVEIHEAWWHECKAADLLRDKDTTFVIDVVDAELVREPRTRPASPEEVARACAHIGLAQSLRTAQQTKAVGAIANEIKEAAKRISRR